MTGREEAQRREDDSWSEVLWTQVIASYVDPELVRRQEAGSLNAEDGLFRFMVLMPPHAENRVLLNREVKGVMRARALRDLAEGEEVRIGDTGEVAEFEPELDVPGTPYIAGLLTATGWTLTYQLAYRHPDAKPVFEHGKAYAATARLARDAGHHGPALDNAFSAVELFAKAELLLAPLEISAKVANSRKHNHIRAPLEDWAALGNVPSDFTKLLARLGQLRGAARYGNRDLDLGTGELDALFARLDDMESHVGRGVLGERSDETYNVWATRDIRGGELVTEENSTTSRAEQQKSRRQSASAGDPTPGDT